MKKQKEITHIGTIKFEKDFEIGWMMWVMEHFKDMGATHMGLRSVMGPGMAMHLPSEVVGHELLAYRYETEEDREIRLEWERYKKENEKILWERYQAAQRKRTEELRAGKTPEYLHYGGFLEEERKRFVK